MYTGTGRVTREKADEFRPGSRAAADLRKAEKGRAAVLGGALLNSLPENWEACTATTCSCTGCCTEEAELLLRAGTELGRGQAAGCRAAGLSSAGPGQLRLKLSLGEAAAKECA
jgi:hypothetical protein